LSLQTLLDTRSPVSFMKAKFVKEIDIKKYASSRQFYGINHSKLVNKGFIYAKIIKNYINYKL